MRITSQSALMRRRFDMVKEAVPVHVLARDLIQERSGRLITSGGRLRGQCPVCHHGNHSQAFSASLTEGLWNCFACGAGGDVIELANLAGGFESPGFAVAWLADRYGVELPARPDSWFQKQDRQARTREALEEKRRDLKRRRLFRVIMIPILRASGATPEEVRAAWSDFGKLPV